jgi:integrase/recombinase XerC
MTGVLAPSPLPRLPALVATLGDRASLRFLEFFPANIRNRNTRRAYSPATREFLAWCEAAGVASIADVKPLHVAAYIEQLGREHAAPTVKQRLAAIRHLFDWLVTGHVILVSPASSVRGPSHSVKRGKTPVLDPSQRLFRPPDRPNTPATSKGRQRTFAWQRTCDLHHSQFVNTGDKLFERRRVA